MQPPQATPDSHGAAPCAVHQPIIDPAHEQAWWRQHFQSRPYVAPDAVFIDYGPAYGMGVDAYGRYPGSSFVEIEPELARDWDLVRGQSVLSWAHARPAALEAWQRVHAQQRVPGDRGNSSGDGRSTWEGRAAEP